MKKSYYETIKDQMRHRGQGDDLKTLAQTFAKGDAAHRAQVLDHLADEDDGGALSIEDAKGFLDRRKTFQTLERINRIKLGRGE